MTQTWQRWLQFALRRAVAKLSYGTTHFRHPLKSRAWDAATKLPRSIPTATTPLECAQIFEAVEAVEKVPGDLAEVGVFRGGTAALMLSASAKRMHLFDTFEGLPHGEGIFERGEWAG